MSQGLIEAFIGAAALAMVSSQIGTMIFVARLDERVKTLMAVMYEGKEQ